MIFMIKRELYLSKIRKFIDKEEIFDKSIFISFLPSNSFKSLKYILKKNVQQYFPGFILTEECIITF